MLRGEFSTHRQSNSSYCSVAHVTSLHAGRIQENRCRSAAYIYEPAEEALGSSLRCQRTRRSKLLLARDRAGLDVASSTISGLIDDDEVQVCCGGDLDGGRRHGLSGHVLLRAAAGDGRRRQLGSGRYPCRRRLRQANPTVSQAALSAAAGSGAVVSDQQLQRWMPTTVIRLEYI